MEKELAEKNLIASLENHIGVLENKQWERLPNSIWSIKDSLDKFKQSRQAAVISSCDCKENECCYYCEFEKTGRRILTMPSD